jgi:hypothetical protein
VGASTELHDADLRRLTEQVIPHGAVEPFGAYLFRVNEPGAELGRYLERTVFMETFGNTPQLLADEYDRYETSSFFICVVDQMRRLPAGVMRVVLPSPAGFKSFDDLEAVWGEPAAEIIERTGLTINRDRTWDIATLAVGGDYRGKATTGLVSMGLYQTLAIAARNCGVEWFITILDMPVFRLVRWKFHMIFAGYKGVAAKPYLGSPASLPAWCDVSDFERRLKAQDPDMYEILVEGTGLEPALRKVDESRTESLVA